MTKCKMSDQSKPSKKTLFNFFMLAVKANENFTVQKQTELSHYKYGNISNTVRITVY